MPLLENWRNAIANRRYRQVDPKRTDRRERDKLPRSGWVPRQGQRVHCAFETNYARSTFYILKRCAPALAVVQNDNASLRERVTSSTRKGFARRSYPPRP